MAKTKVGIINVTGYAGVELARLLAQHPCVELTSVTGRSAAGHSLTEIFPHLNKLSLTIESKLGDVDFVFSAMPHKDSAAEIIPLLERGGVKVVDISADFRLKDAAAYPQWYDFTHPAPHLLEEAVYGLPELHRKKIAAARLVANPGCYPTSAILAMAPAVKQGLIEPDIIIDSKSGISGAGRSLSLKVHFSEANEDVTAYSLEGHRHFPEIVQELTALNPKRPPAVTFVPHLIPMTRGILTTAYARLVPGKIASGKSGEEELRDTYRSFYKDQPFVKVVDFPPHTKYTWGNNDCYIYPTIDQRTGRLIVISCLDNLVKGAAGQAIQNMNLMLGLPETTGLEAMAIFPVGKNMANYTHLELNEQIDSLAGYYVPLEEERLKFNGREVLYVVGQALVDASCCGFSNRAYVLVPGYILNWKNKTNENNLPVSEVEPVTDKGTQDAIRKIISETEQIPQVDFWH